jgi:cytoplasmic iron level regulating protein YaaA (DUF328/UPF0246 family)
VGKNRNIGKKMVQWWNNECKNAIKEINHAFRILRNHLSQDNLIKYQRKKARARKVIKSSKKSAWTQFYCEVQLGDI